MGSRTAILGLNAFHGDSSACLVIDGQLVAAAEEERFRRIKHWAGFPSEAVKYCLEAGGITAAELDHIAINRDPSANMLKKVLFTLKKRPDLAAIKNRLSNAAHIGGVLEDIANCTDTPISEMKANVHRIEHHRAHMGSAFLVSPYKQAAILSVDGFGDFVSTQWGYGDGTRMKMLDRVSFPHSLGLFYLAITQYLGFWNYGDEYKVMGLAPYGEPRYLEQMRKVVQLTPGGRFELELSYFLHHSEGVSMVWDGGSPTLGRAFSEDLGELLGAPREKGEALTQFHHDIAASTQAMYEEAFFHILNQIASDTHFDAICLAGGCAMNSVANGKITDRTRFKEVYVQAAGGDAGGALGAAYCVWNQAMSMPRVETMTNAYVGPEFDNDAIAAELAGESAELTTKNCRVRKMDDEELAQVIAQRLADGAVVGWFQGRMEWGPRALGNRSILGDPRRTDMRDLLNLKIKRRESFRPFAPSVLREEVSEWFEKDGDVPFMAEVWPVRADKHAIIPAVTHVDGSGRLQTVRSEDNPLYHRLISCFKELTGVPILLNTSFNENEPVVCRPSEALSCFLRTEMDVLVLGNHVVERMPEPEAALPRKTTNNVPDRV
ncbi:MAG: carbamoyltransferase [Planctomycetota bacterium]|jgi:carbamoyltransferase